MLILLVAFLALQSACRYDVGGAPSVDMAGAEIGQDLRIDIERMSPKKIRVRVTNLSRQTAYCAFNRGKDGQVEYFSLVREEYDLVSGEFRVANENHYVPALSAIESGETIVVGTYTFDHPGIFRASVPYYIDREAVLLLQKSRFTDMSSVEQLVVERASRVATSPVFTLTDENGFNFGQRKTGSSGLEEISWTIPGSKLAQTPETRKKKSGSDLQYCI
ncbi:MAG: hypothetical protein AB7J13_06560, partial [Pyrinomonadaceae bacterium]